MPDDNDCGIIDVKPTSSNKNVAVTMEPIIGGQALNSVTGAEACAQRCAEYQDPDSGDYCGGCVRRDDQFRGKLV